MEAYAARLPPFDGRDMETKYEAESEADQQAFREVAISEFARGRDAYALNDVVVRDDATGQEVARADLALSVRREAATYGQRYRPFAITITK